MDLHLNTILFSVTIVVESQATTTYEERNICSIVVLHDLGENCARTLRLSTDHPRIGYFISVFGYNCDFYLKTSLRSKKMFRNNERNFDILLILSI